MALNDLRPRIRFEFTPGVWTDVSAYWDNRSRLGGSAGTDPYTRKPQNSSARFSLGNRSGAWTLDDAAATYYGKLDKGVRVEIAATLAPSTVYPVFLGRVTDFGNTFDEVSRTANRVWIEAEDELAFLREIAEYSMPALENNDLDDAAAAIMAAMGSSAYSFVDSAYTLPYVYSRESPTADLLAVLGAELGGLVFTDRSGLLRNKRAADMIGGYASPTHTWTPATKIQPEGDVVPDYRRASQFAKVTARVTKITITAQIGKVWEWNASSDAGIAEPFEQNAKRRITARLDEAAFSVAAAAGGASAAPFEDSGVVLWTSMSSSVGYFYPSTGGQFDVNEWLRVETEFLIITSIQPAVGTNREKVFVQRGALGGGAAVNHATGSVVYRRKMTRTYETVGTVAGGMTQLATKVSINYGAGDIRDKVQIGTTLKTNLGEFIVVTSEPTQPVPGPWTMDVNRGQRGTSAMATTANTGISREIVDYDAGLPGGGFTIRGSANADGSGATTGDFVPLASWVTPQANTFPMGLIWRGRDLVFDVMNQATALRYLVSITLSSSYFTRSTKTGEYVLRQPIPRVLGDPDGPSIALPYGHQDFRYVKAYMAGLLRGGRIAAPWQTLTLTANPSEATASVMAAEIGDLVRYTGTDREKTDGFYRIVGYKWAVDPGKGGFPLWRYTFTLMPAHLVVDPARSWYTNFDWTVDASGKGLGYFNAAPPGSDKWTASTTWLIVFPGGTSYTWGADALPEPTYATAPGSANPTPLWKNAGSQDQKVAAGVILGTAGHNTYGTNAQGVGVSFRANSTGSEHWRAWFNETLSQVILANTADGVVATAAWTPDAGRAPEIEVRAQSTTIEVRIDARALPLIRVTGQTRYNDGAHSYAAPSFSRTIAVAGTSYPGFDWYSQQAI